MKFLITALSLATLSNTAFAVDLTTNLKDCPKYVEFKKCTSYKNGEATELKEFEGMQEFKFGINSKGKLIVWGDEVKLGASYRSESGYGVQSEARNINCFNNEDDGIRGYQEHSFGSLRLDGDDDLWSFNSVATFGEEGGKKKLLIMTEGMGVDPNSGIKITLSKTICE